MIRQLEKKMCRSRIKRRGMTFVETTISVGIGLMVFLMIYRFMSGTRHHYMYGTVNLQNLQEARLAVNYLRRDFSCACPRIDDPAVSGFVNLQKVRNQAFMSNSWAGTGGDLIQVLPNGLLFHKFVFASPDEKPGVELVRYEFDAAARTLVRHGEDGKTQKFSGFEEVEFRLYTHEVNPKVPILWARFKVHEGEKIYGNEEIGKAVELTTSIASPFLTSSSNNRYWRYEIGHKKL